MKTAIHGRWNRHCSSLEEARNLWRIREDFDKGRASGHELAAAKSELTFQFLHLLEELGLDVISDGGFWWDSALDITRKLRGCEGFKTLHRIEETNHFHRAPEISTLPVWQGPILKSYLEAAQSATKKEVLISLAGPYTLARQSIILNPNISVLDLAFAYAQALNWEMEELLKSGAAAVKVDDPHILLYPQDREAVKRVFAVLTRGLNQKKVFLGTWFCGIGDWKDYFDLPFGGFFLDLASNWRVQTENFCGLLRRFPNDKVLGAGLIDARQPHLEFITDLRYWVQSILKRVDSEQIYLCPNTDLTFLPWDVSVEKVKRLVALAKEARQ